MSGDYIKIKLPKNPLVILTVILGILLVAAIVFIIFSSAGVNSLGTGVISQNQAGQRVINFLNTQTNSSVQLKNITEMSGVYQMYVSYQGQSLPVYSTRDGKYLIQYLIPVY